MIYERITHDPMFDGPVRERHESRYRIAASFVRDGESVLDAGCGAGYAEPIFGSVGARWIGVDRDPPNNRNAYGGDLERLEADQYAWRSGYDVFVGFEVIEHLNDYSNFIRLAHAAKRTLLVSAPIVPTVGKNPFHRHDFTMDSLKAAFEHPDWRLTWEMRQHDARSGIIVMEHD